MRGWLLCSIRRGAPFAALAALAAWGIHALTGKKEEAAEKEAEQTKDK